MPSNIIRIMYKSFKLMSRNEQKRNLAIKQIVRIYSNCPNLCVCKTCMNSCERCAMEFYFWLAFVDEIVLRSYKGITESVNFD